MSYKGYRLSLGCVGFLTVAFACMARPAQAAVTFGQLDDFQDGSMMGWDEGFSSINAPTNAAGGRAGAADRYIRNVASGGFGGGSKQIMFNQAQWAGDYNAAGVTRVRGFVANFGSTPLHVRVALEGLFTRWSSTAALDLPADGAWRPFSFDLTAGAMTRVQGTAAFDDSIAAVSEFRILSSASPSYMGDAVASTLGVDDIRALRPEGDANFDGRVDGADLRALRSNLGKGITGGTWQQGDFNFDGRVNARDLALLRRNFTRTAGAAEGGISVVPEPANGALITLVALSVLRRRRYHAGS